MVFNSTLYFTGQIKEKERKQHIQITTCMILPNSDTLIHQKTSSLFPFPMKQLILIEQSRNYSKVLLAKFKYTRNFLIIQYIYLSVADPAEGNYHDYYLAFMGAKFNVVYKTL